MIIKSMDASFGGLENAHMELEPGLNIIEAPNEAGKSTWCGFIRAMLYGINTSQREKAGLLPDKKRFLPWGNYPMTGSMRLEWRGGDVTLSRKGGAGKPMGACEAKMSGTAEKVPELCGKAPGEVILGVPESVFRRSAFISGGAMAVDKDAELEKRISALISSGSEEDEAYSTAHDTLHNWRVKRKHNARVGRVAELTAAISEKSAALDRIEEESSRLGGIYAEREDVLSSVSTLEEELRLHDAERLRLEYEKAASARTAREQAERELERLRDEAGDISAAKVAAARAALSGYREAAAAVKAGSQAVTRHNEAVAELERAQDRLQKAQAAAAGVSAGGIAAARRALMEYESAREGEDKARAALERFNALPEEAPASKKAPLALAAAGIALMLLGAVGCLLHPAVLSLTAVGAVLLVVYLLRKRSDVRESSAASEAKRAEGAVYESLTKEAEERRRAAERELTEALAAIGGETIPQRAEGRIKEREALLESLEQAKSEAAAALQVERGLAPATESVSAAVDREEAAASALYEALTALDIDPAAMNIPALIEEKGALLDALSRAESSYISARRLAESLGEPPAPPEGMRSLPAPAMEREEARAALDRARGRAAELERMLAVSEGELRHLGDPLVLATELENLRAELDRNEEEYEALSLAMSVLEEANA